MTKNLIVNSLKAVVGGAIIALGGLVTLGAVFNAGMSTGVNGVCRVIARDIQNGDDMTLSEFAEKYGGKE